MFASCKKDDGAPDNNPAKVNMQNLALSGTVRDAAGNPLGGVLVSTGSLSATTGANGTFAFEQAATLNNRALVRFEKSGYFALTRSGVKADEITLDVVMRRKGNSGASSQTSFNANEDRTLMAGEMKVAVPASALVRADGSAYTGTVNADMLYLDPNADDFAATMPGGDLVAIRSDNRVVQLVSYGMTEISLTDPAGMENNPPATIPLWYFDEERGVWVEEGTATLQGNVYVGSVEHFSWYKNIAISAMLQPKKGIRKAPINTMLQPKKTKF